MSLGSRICHRSRPFVSSELLATPRDCLWFLYPRWFTSTTSPPRGTAPAPTNHLSNQARNATQRQSDISKQYLSELDRRHESSRPISATTTQQTSSPSIAEESQGKRPFKLATSTELSNDRRLAGMKMMSLDNALKGSSEEILQSSFILQPAQIRRFERFARRYEAFEDYKEASESNRRIKSQGSWSYDWQVPLMDLRRYYQEDTVQPVSADFIRPYLHGKSPKYKNVRAQEIPQPLVWSPMSFASHVEDLTQSKVSRVMHRQIYQHGEDHQTAVRDSLLAMFKDPYLKPLITVQAFDTAIVFLYKHSMISSVRELFSLMTQLRLEIPSETFNIMLRSAAYRKDLHAFTFLLRIMIDRGARPNAGTWVAFLTAINSKTIINSKAVKLHVARVMRTKGMLAKPANLRGVVSQLLDIEMASHLRKGLALDAFINYLDLKFGSSWMSLSASHKVCHALADLGRLPDAIKMLDIMSKRGVGPDQRTLQIFIKYCCRLNTLDHIIDVLRLFNVKYGIHPEARAYDLLFMLAWRSRSYNASRVVWRVACLEATVSYRMQRIVKETLLRNTPDSPQTRTETWMKSAGKVVIGIDFHLHASPGKAAPECKILQRLIRWSQTGVDRTTSLALAKEVLTRDLLASKHYRLNEDFLELFAKAVVLDRAWAADKVWVDKGTWWMAQNSIPVRVVDIAEGMLAEKNISEADGVGEEEDMTMETHGR